MPPSPFRECPLLARGSPGPCKPTDKLAAAQPVAAYTSPLPHPILSHEGPKVTSALAALPVCSPIL